MNNVESESAPLRVFSFGGGVQSMAALCHQAQRRIFYDAVLFSNVGEDSEFPDTLTYFHEYAQPFAEEFGLKLIELHREMKLDGVTRPVTLRGELERAERSVIIPAYLASGKPGNRTCTVDFKIRVIDRWIRAQKPRPQRAVVGLGISIDEHERARDTGWHDRESKSEANPHKFGFWKQREYPLIELRINRSRAMGIIREFGLPVPPKSSCYFCPFHSRASWIELKRDHPDLFAKAVEVERICNQTRLKVERDPVFLHTSRKPLDEAVGDQMALFGEDKDGDGCADGGYCMV